MTICNNTDKTLLQLVDEATESEPAESEKLRKGEPQDVTGGTINTALKSSSGKLTKEVKCELAVIAVKRAFSQCPNLSLLVSIQTHTAIQHTTLHCTTLQCATQHCTTLHYSTLLCSALHMISGVDYSSTMQSTLPFLVSFYHLPLFIVSLCISPNTLLLHSLFLLFFSPIFSSLHFSF